MLFSKFAVYYGNLWRSQFKSDEFREFAKKEWLVALDHFKDETLEEAINDCRKHSVMPPTLPEMVRHCKDVVRRHDFKPGPVKGITENPEIAEFNLNRCREILAGKHKGK